MRQVKEQPIVLKDGSKIVVIGGGPAGAFFAIKMLRSAKEAGRQIAVTLIEKKIELRFYESACSGAYREGCNYCAGGISPRMSDVLEEMGLALPAEILQGQATTLTVQGDWKNIELRIPEGRKIFLVYRGSKPKGRVDRYFNFDSYLLEKAVQEGARVITGAVHNVQCGRTGKPLVYYRISAGAVCRDEHMEADFLVFAGGVNHDLGLPTGMNQLHRVVQNVIPGFAPPRVRRTLIFELEVDEEFMRKIQGELYFIEYGSKDLKIEASSLMPKGKFTTIVLIGPNIDSASPSENTDIIQKFLELPHIRRLLPKSVKLATVCVCNPNITVGVAKNPFGHRVAVIGDMVAARLYKDGILSAYLTASALVTTIFDKGLDRASLKKGFYPVIKAFQTDNWFGKLVFMFNRITFSSPILSRILYQAVITERKTRTKANRRLERIVWEIASGDNQYEDVFFSMFHPATIASIMVGGVLITLRNYLTELLLGLKWQGFGRYPTGVYRESLEAKRKEFVQDLGMDQLKTYPEFERIYSIRIKADRQEILRHLGKFGDEDRQYLRPRILKIYRIYGKANQVGSIIQYDTPLKCLSFSVVLEKIMSERYLIYRVRDGYARGGVLVFDIEKLRQEDFLLSIYVAFYFPKSKSLIKRFFWAVFKFFFPGFIHDVLWNHSLCKLKDIIEMGEDGYLKKLDKKPSGNIFPHRPLTPNTS